MGNNQDSPKSSGACEKILHAVSFHPACKKRHRISHRQQDPRPTSPASNPSLPMHNHVAKPDHEHPNSAEGSKFLEADEIPIEFDYSSLQHPPKEKGKSATAATHLPIQNSNITPLTKVASRRQEKPNEKHHVVKVEPQPDQVQKEGKQPGHDMNEIFSDYIKRAKMKIRSVSNVGGGKNASQQDDADHDQTKKKDTAKDSTAKDQFSEYINRAKMKIRATSSIGRGKTVSFKNESRRLQEASNKQRSLYNNFIYGFLCFHAKHSWKLEAYLRSNDCVK